ncbi:uncharacterized protein LOC135950678 [Calliphora vicina]|uniref:uncharacterized protein LOC135950678 n=1 Tax=Calliphora vicina TaxID=7373 RepID=UPI00325B23D2
MDAFLTERIQTLECLRDIRETPQTKVPSVQNVKTHHANSASNSHFCVLCKNQSHFLRDCKRFKNLSVSERFSTIKRHHCCVNCLSRTHEVRKCTSVHSCSTCQKRHHTLLHRSTSSSDDSTENSNTGASSVVASPPTNSWPVESSASTSRKNNPGPSNRQVFHLSNNRTVLLGTAMVNIRHQGMTYPARALIDPGSETSFISERVQNRLKISAHLTNAQISGVNQTITATSTKLCSIEIGSPLDTSINLRTTALVLPNISGKLPSFVMSDELCGNLPNLKLADSQFFNCRPVDLLLGTDLYPQIILREIRTNFLGSLLAQNTIFGWIITGPVPSSSVQVFNTRVEFSEEDNLNSSLLRFWELEEAPKRKIISLYDRICEENYKRTTRRGTDGRYIVTLPFKPEFPEKLSLDSSKQNVRAQFLRTEASLLRKSQIKEMYDEVVKEYLVLGHMRPIVETSSSISSCYLPHHPVIKLDRKTTKLRLADDSESQYPLASKILRKGMYVDDVLTGTHDVETALIARDQLVAALSSAGFNLRKWTSNDKAILAGFSPEYLIDEKLLVFVESSSSKTLGLQWNAHLDVFYFRVNPIARRSHYTKREVLSTIAKLFDPVGWLGPVLVVAKMLMQKVWQDQIDWDEDIKMSTQTEWEKFVASYHEVNCIQIPRWVHYEPESSVELHVFSDASEKAYAGVIYIRVETPRGEIFTHLLTCMTKVAPIKSVTLPRLELCGAVLAADLLKAVLNRYSYDTITLSENEVRHVKLRLAIVAQKGNFTEEYKCLLEKRPLSSKSSLLPLNPFLDNEGVMRLNGRLARPPSLVYTEWHPILLPYSCRFTLLLAEFIHKISIHGGNQLMLRIIRIEYWIPRLKTLVRTIVNRCKQCVLDRKRACTQLMAALPPERTNLDRPSKI